VSAGGTGNSLPLRGSCSRDWKFVARTVPMRFGAFDLIKGGIRG